MPCKGDKMKDAEVMPFYADSTYLLSDIDTAFFIGTEIIFARITLIISFTRNNPETVRKDAANEFDVTAAYCSTPHKWHTIMPDIPRSVLKIFEKFSPAAHKITIAKKPKINPPVAPNSFENPAPKPENTGSPTAPRRIYTKTAAHPFFAPIMYPHKATAKVCSVNGIPNGVGIAICEQTHNIAVNSAVKIMFFVFVCCILHPNF